MNVSTLKMLSFLRPWWLLALLPLGMLVWRNWRAARRGEAAWHGLIDAHLLPHLLVFPAARASRAAHGLFAGGLLLAVLALAGPMMEQPQQAYRRDVTRVLVIDLSPGMAGQLEQVKLKIFRLLQAWPDGQTALLVYGGEPYLVVPPTIDAKTIALFIPELSSDAIPMPGNRPERALRMAAAVLDRSAARQREIFWITGGADGAELPLSELTGEQGKTRLSILHTATRLDPALAAAASGTGGILVRLRADGDDIGQLVRAAATGSAWTAGTSTARRSGTDLGYWLLLPLLPLAALAFRSGILALLLPLLLAGLLAPPPASAFDFASAPVLADYRAWRLLEAGQPEAAAGHFADLRWRAAAYYRAGHFEQAAKLLASVSDADSDYNRGNALARQGQLAEALVAYDTALKRRPNDGDTRHNRDLVQRLLKPPANPPKSNGSGGGKGQAPPAPASRAAQSQGGDAEREAARLAEQWLRGIPDRPGTLLRRKLQLEHRHRQAGTAERSW